MKDDGDGEACMLKDIGNAIAWQLFANIGFKEAAMEAAGRQFPASQSPQHKFPATPPPRRQAGAQQDHIYTVNIPGYKSITKLNGTCYISFKAFSC